MRTTQRRQAAILIVVLLIPFFLFSQILVRPSGFNLHLFDYQAVFDGKVKPYLTSHLSYEWRQSMPKGSNDLLRSDLGDSWLRKNRLKFFPTLSATAYLNGGHVKREGAFVDIAPMINIFARYKFLPTGRYSLIFWTRFEKHSVVSQSEITDFSYDFNWQKEIGRRVYKGGDSTWIEYDIGDGGILFSYPNGEVTFAQSNPIWGPGYTGQLYLSDKAPSFVFLSFRHRFTEKWTFSYFHGSLNSTFRDSTHLELYPVKGGMPLVRKYIAAHRIDFLPRENVRIGFGESVVYGGRNVEMSYALPFLPYWSAQHDLSDSDNLQMFLDFEIIRKGIGRFYGSVYIDEWDFVTTFNKEESHNWWAYQAGITYDLPILSYWNSLLRFEMTHLTPYVYVHRSKINTFQHHGHYLGFWSGPNSESIFLAFEGSPYQGWWIQLYGVVVRRGEVNDYTIEKQYKPDKVPFLYRTYEGDAEMRTLLGFRGELLLLSFIRVSFNLYWDKWLQRLNLDNGERTESQKFDGILQFSIGL